MSVRRGFALGAVTVLCADLVAALTIWPPTTVVAGTAQPVSATVAGGAPAAPAQQDVAPPPEIVPTTPPPTPTPQPEQAPVSAPPQGPGTIRLPAGGGAKLIRKDLGPGAELPVPENLDEVTWWGAELSSATGASVFAGHVNWKGATGPFAELWNDRIGGDVTVVDKAGKSWRYKVSQLITLKKNELPQRADELFGQSGRHRIVLVTCGGRWIGGETGYAENRVVIADPA
ncbi:class F sortase [Amycolatopsis regifaucium]|uniref:Sortase n=1 Tax=Amycolatopsis regifaucium TaxID=546365 RepID=A0A154MVT1_9PSEU|nr:class F sortase [Amycolatopsis regifaucium]KZB87569.1 sortase [Amycolatopsis regifaucium]OKA08399.1 class F sortase [Amycolatopsis regifaucium]SFI09619.1 Sortase family protein [Amycolatopsis regifaucium]